MSRKYNTYTPETKLKIAIEAAKNEKTLNQIASEFGVCPSLVGDWKKQLLENGTKLFQGKQQPKVIPEAHENVSVLQQQVGRLTVQLEWLKKSLAPPSE